MHRPSRLARKLKLDSEIRSVAIRGIPLRGKRLRPSALSLLALAVSQPISAPSFLLPPGCSYRAVVFAQAAINRQREIPIPFESRLVGIGYGLALGQPLAVSHS